MPSKESISVLGFAAVVALSVSAPMSETASNNHYNHYAVLSETQQDLAISSAMTLLRLIPGRSTA